MTPLKINDEVIIYHNNKPYKKVKIVKLLKKYALGESDYKFDLQYDEKNGWINAYGKIHFATSYYFATSEHLNKYIVEYLKTLIKNHISKLDTYNCTKEDLKEIEDLLKKLSIKQQN